MRLILAGCEYAGTSTLARAIADWTVRQLNATVVRVHDHWVFPYLADQDPTTCFLVGPDGVVQETGRYGDSGLRGDQATLTERWADDIEGLSPWLLEQLQRAMIWRHMHPTMTDVTTERQDSIQVGLHYAEAVYAPLFYGYDGPASFTDRVRRAREWDQVLLQMMPDVVLVLVRATPEEVRERMKAEPRPRGLLRDKDVERIIDLFEEQFSNSGLAHKLAIDTSGQTAEESVAEFARKIEPVLTDADRRRRTR